MIDIIGRTTSSVIHWPYEQAGVECVVTERDQACAVTDG